MALQDSYTSGDDGQETISGSAFAAQIFTASSTYDLSSVELYVNKNGAGGSIDVIIFPVSGGEPSLGGGSVSSGSFDSSGLAGNTWQAVAMSAASLSSGTQYAIVVSADNDGCVWRRDGSSPTYAGGYASLSADGGSNWTNDTGKDFLFKVNGDGFTPPAARPTVRRLAAAAKSSFWYEDI